MFSVFILTLSVSSWNIKVIEGIVQRHMKKKCFKVVSAISIAGFSCSFLMLYQDCHTWYSVIFMLLLFSTQTAAKMIKFRSTRLCHFCTLIIVMLEYFLMYYIRMYSNNGWLYVSSAIVVSNRHGVFVVQIPFMLCTVQHMKIGMYSILITFELWSMLL